MRSADLRRMPWTLCTAVALVVLALAAIPAAAATASDDCAMRAMKPAALVEAKRDGGATFPVAELLAADRGLSTKALGVPDEVAREGALHRPDFGAIARFLKRAPETFTLPVDGPSGVTELELVRVDITTPDFKVVTSASNGEAVPYEPGVHYRGKVKGDPDSYAAVSVFKDEVMGSYSSPTEDTVVIGRVRGNNPGGEHIVYATRTIDEHNQFTCDNNEDGPETEPVDQPVEASEPFDFSSFSNLPPPAAIPAAKSLDVKAGNKCVRIYVETAYDMYQSLGSISAVANYVTGFFNQSAVLYSHESIPIGLSEIFVWYGPDPYTGDNMTAILGNFVNYRRTFNGDFGHLVAFHGGGGLANNIGAFCNADPGERTCFSGVDPSYANVPTYSWTVNVFTHEMGHLMGSPHTHACAWNGNRTQIDGCADPEPIGGCPRIGLPAGGGTIMSYCHLQSVGIRFNNGFGTQPGNLIRSRFNAAGCLGPCGGTVGPPNCPAPTQCGTIRCPTGCYPASTNGCGTGLTGNQTTCREVSGPRLTTCEDHCPAGYYVQASRSGVSSCERGYNGIQMDCAQVAGNTLTTCQTLCPNGYYPSFISRNQATCAVGFGNWQTRCDKVNSNTLTTCADDCPTGFYPFSTTGSSASCGGVTGPYGGIQTQCRLTQGTTLNVCGSSCPAGYFLQRTNTGVPSCQERYFGVQSVCTNSPTQQCDEGCPDGYYVTRTAPDSGCINHVRTFCAPVTGNSLTTCQDVCPTGFYASAAKANVADCTLIWFGLQTQCQRVQGNLLRTCEDRCPDDYYPSAADTGVPVCAVRYGGVQTDCSKITGDTLITCGQTCPPNFLPGLISPNDRCSTAYQNVQRVCTRVPPVGEPRITQQPQSVTIVAGQSTTLSVSVTGQSPITFQWYRGAAGDRTNPISGAIGQSVIVKPTVTTSYWVLVKNNKGEVASETATVTVTPSCIPPAITAQPQPVSIPAGGTATLSVAATGTDLLYQWYVGVFLGWSPISGATASSVDVSPAATSNYKVTVHNSCGTVDSSSVLVTVTQPCTAPAITTQPHSTTIVDGDTALLSVAATGSDLRYQWYEGDSGDLSRPIAGATLASYRAQPRTTTHYWVRVSNGCGHADSNTAVVTVTPACVPPTIVAAPPPVAIDAGQSASLTVTASGTTLSYQWYEGFGGDQSHPIAGATSATVVVTPAVTTTYWVSVFNGCGSGGTSGTTVTVRPTCVPPTIGSQPQSAAITAGQSATLTVGAGGSDLNYQWYEGAASDQTHPIPGGNGASLTVSPTETTSYWVRISNGCGSVDSRTASVTVSPACVAPAITTQPQPAAINAGQTATLSVSAGGTDISYQWYAGSSGDTSQPVPGATSSSVNVSPTTTTNYWVRVSNSCGTADSAAATVTVTPACVSPAITAQPQSVTINDGQSASLAAAASGTSPSFQWYRGSSPDTSSPVSGGVGTSIVVSPSSTTSYWMRAANDCGVADSQSAVVTVTPACVRPTVTQQPRSVTITFGESTTLSVGVTGTSPLAYQWYRGSVSNPFDPVPGGNGPSLTVSPTSTTMYWVQINNGCGSDSSVAATVTVEPICNPPSIQSQPQSVTINQGDTAMLAVSGSGTSVGYQWYRGFAADTSNPVVGGVDSVLFVSPATTTNYWVRLFNSCGSANSSTATVTVNTGCGPDGTPCGGDGHHTCQNNQCACTDCGSAVCCGSTGNSFCDGQQFFDANTGYNGACAATLPACTRSNDFDGDNELYHNGDIFACVKKDGLFQWFKRRPSPRCLEVGPVCTYLCAYHFQAGQGFQCQDDGWWSQNPPLPYCNGGVLPDGFACN